MEIQFVTLDVFTSVRLQGNPLAVVLVPAELKHSLTQAMKQKIAQEFNLSETVFLHEAADPEDEERHIDIFTTETELPYAGHPTIGSAVLLKYHMHPHVKTLITKAGPIAIVPQPGNGIRAKIPHNVHLHRGLLGDALGGETLDHPGLSSEAEIRLQELVAPVFSVVKGMTFILVRLMSLEILGQVSASYRLDFNALQQPLLDEGWRDSFVARYYYVDLGEEAGERIFRTRMVELGSEDPATGSAATALAAFVQSENPHPMKFKITQGVEIGRTSHISVETTLKPEGGLGEIWLGGTAVVVMKGTLNIDV
ncbi:Diaminopimelate epimerase-like protein [Jackrogersella minutella]|nr:Diaminopimelate epimerase-like protein [Jackrogersella minutella]